jgi:hypothetical protein
LIEPGPKIAILFPFTAETRGKSHGPVSLVIEGRHT